MIRFINLQKSYKTKNNEVIKALDGFNLDIDDNEIFALAGINGAGKTTALKALFHLINLDDGKIEISQSNSKKGNLGFAPEIPDLPEYFTVKETLEISCKLTGVEPSEDLINKAIETFELQSMQDKLISTLSKGNKQRVSLASAVVYDPEIIVFDEPTSGLDPIGRKLIKTAIKKLKSEGRTLLFSTHILSDLPELCDKMAIVHKGKIVFAGKVSDFSENTSFEELEKSFAKLISLEA